MRYLTLDHSQRSLLLISYKKAKKKIENPSRPHADRKY